MERVIVTVKRQGEARVRDLEVPADIQSEDLARLIAEALHWDTDAAGQHMDYRIQVHPLGRQLAPGESLQDAGAWDGSWLVLLPSGGQAPSQAQRPPRAAAEPTPPEGPVRGFRSLGVDVADTTQAPPAHEPPAPAPGRRTSGFVWRQLD